LLHFSLFFLGMIMRPRRLATGPLVAGFLLLTLIGCGPGRGDLSGTVTFGKKPLRFGSVSALGADGIPKSGLIKDDGTYTITDIATGPIKICVTSADPAASQPAERIPGTPQPKVDRTGWFAIPDKYGDFAKSELTFDLKRGANTFNIDLK
jgi:hypothetical protein